MKKLSKEQSERKDRLADELRKAEDAANELIKEANTKIAEANEAIQKLNEAIGEAETFKDEVTGDIESYMDERSEKWQESDRADLYRDWKSQYESLDVTQAEELEQIEELTIGDQLASDLEQNCATEVE